MEQHYATKADLATLEARLTRWMIGSMFSATAIMAGITFAIVRLMSVA